jgi:hypothetical protein
VRLGNQAHVITALAGARGENRPHDITQTPSCDGMERMMELIKWIRTALSCHTKDDQPWGPVFLSEDEFEAIKRTMLEPRGPTESIKRGAELLRRLYGPRS